MSLAVDVLAGAVRGGTPILFAATGETLSERAGVINLGTEGCMLVGALGGYAITANTGNPWVGALAGGAAGAGLGLVHALMVVTRRADQLATGLVIMFLGMGITSLFGGPYVHRNIHAFSLVAIPGLSRLPWLGPILFRHDPLTYLSMVLVVVMWWFLYHTRWGLLVRGAGERSEVLHTYGHGVRRVQILAVTFGGFLAGVGGAQLSTAYAKAWFENMTVGRGFIAVALVIFAAWEPLKVIWGAYLFGAALALAPALQARGYALNQFGLDALPYVVTLVVLVILGRRRARGLPEGLKAVLSPVH